jgi:hypothetical protein
MDAAISWGQRAYAYRIWLYRITQALLFVGAAVFGILQQWWQAILLGFLLLSSIAGQIYVLRLRRPATLPMMQRQAQDTTLVSQSRAIHSAPARGRRPLAGLQ